MFCAILQKEDLLVYIYRIAGKFDGDIIWQKVDE